MFKVTLQLWLFNLTTNETLGVKDRVGRVGVKCVLGRITDPGLWVSTKIEGRGEMAGRTYSRSSSVKATHEGVIR